MRILSHIHVNCLSRMFTIYKINNYAPNRIYRTSCAISLRKKNVNSQEARTVFSILTLFILNHFQFWLKIFFTPRFGTSFKKK